MAKAARKEAVTKDEAQGQAAAAAWIEVHDSDERAEAMPALVQLAVRAWELVMRIDELNVELTALKSELASAVGAGRSLVVPKVCRVSVVSARTVKVVDAKKLRALLGDRWGDLVTETVSYKPTEKLIEMSVDGDDPMAPAYRELLSVCTSTSVRITAQK
jgi:hypothetical protein